MECLHSWLWYDVIWCITLFYLTHVMLSCYMKLVLTSDMVHYTILSHSRHVIMLHEIVINNMTIVFRSLYITYWTWSVYTHDYDMMWYGVLYYSISLASCYHATWNYCYYQVIWCIILFYLTLVMLSCYMKLLLTSDGALYYSISLTSCYHVTWNCY